MLVLKLVGLALIVCVAMCLGIVLVILRKLLDFLHTLIQILVNRVDSGLMWVIARGEKLSREKREK